MIGHNLQKLNARKSVLLIAWPLALSLLWARSVWAQPNPSSDTADRRTAETGLRMTMDGDLDGAAKVFHQIEQADPDSPLGFVMEANVTWWEIYYTSANLIDPDVFDAANKEGTVYDAHFENIDELAIHKAETRIHDRQEVARSNLYAGFAFALRGRLDGLYDRDLSTARSGKKMRAHLMKAVELDPSLTDAYLGIGIYNYFVDTLPGIVKMLSVFIGLPPGSRTQGLEQLTRCAEHGELGKPEAMFYLAKDYSRWNEKQYAKSMQLFGEMQRSYPDNPLWPMLMGSLEYRLGDSQKGEQLYRQVYQSTTGKSSLVDKAVHRAAVQAIQKQHPDQKLQ